MRRPLTLPEAAKKEMARCVRCGACMKVCPVFEVMRREGGVARGKIALADAVLRGDIPDGRLYRYFLSACLLCGRCASSCPNQVDTPLIVQAARVELAAKRRGGALKRFLLGRVPSSLRLTGLLKTARALRWLWARRIPRESGLRIRFFGPRGERRIIPTVATSFFLERELPRDFAGPGMRVALFVGCVSNYLRPQAAASALQSLQAAGACVAVPAAQACCGLPAFGAGDERSARKLLRRNLDALLPPGAERSWPEAITSPCASCAYMLKQHLPELLGDDPEGMARAAELSRRVVPFSRLLSTLSGWSAEGPGREVSGPARVVTYHDPCHLSRGFGEKDAPRFVLTRLPGMRLVEMEHPCHCCGHGGSFNLTHYDLSRAIARTKVERVLATGADLLVTECSGCWLQLNEAMQETRPGFEVITTAEAAARLVDLSKEKK
ncbi:MAG: (Fe-S)-binding protein [Myxococcales bacterium]|nr:(Fe-S)-binding protein [Myxococcales bacterium]